MFTIVDLSKGNYHIKFDEAISFLTIFNTHVVDLDSPEWHFD